MRKRNPETRDPGRIGRRELLFASLSAGIAALCPPALAQGRPDFGSLAALVDTLLPADAVSPAASALGVERELEGYLTRTDLMARLSGAALGWLDGLADRPFRDLTEAQRIEIVSFMAQADYNQIPGRFYHVVRALACELYYARPEAIAGYPLHPAPQPQGYPPPWS